MAKLIMTKEEKAAGTWLDLPDDTLGKVTRKLILDMPKLCEKDVEAKGMDKRLWLASCLNILIGVCHEMNATESDYKIEGYTIANKACGNWKITVRRTDKRKHTMLSAMTRLIAALCLVESHNNPAAIGDGGRSVGILQISQGVIDDVNYMTNGGYRLKLADARDPQMAAFICRQYLNRWCPRRTNETDLMWMERAARTWNGGPLGWNKECTRAYWSKVERALDQLDAQEPEIKS